MNIEDKVEKIVYPLAISDAYDTGVMKEVLTQT